MANKCTDPRIIERDAKILALRGTMGVKEIARTLGTTKGVVSGVCFRADRPTYRQPRRTRTPVVQVTTCVPPDLHIEARRLAAKREISLSDLFRNLVRDEVAKARELEGAP